MNRFQHYQISWQICRRIAGFLLVFAAVLPLLAVRAEKANLFFIHSTNVVRGATDWGTIGAWAWGHSRVMDWEKFMDFADRRMKRRAAPDQEYVRDLSELLSIPSVSSDKTANDRAIDRMQAFLEKRGVWCAVERWPEDGRISTSSAISCSRRRGNEEAVAKIRRTQIVDDADLID